jgi:hypothetical protein
VSRSIGEHYTGEAGARCDSEAANTITLNRIHEIVTGKRTVEEAREVYAENMAGYTIGRPAAYAERLLFPVPQGGTEDPTRTWACRRCSIRRPGR